MEANQRLLRELVVRKVEWGANRATVSITLGDREHRVWFAASEGMCREPDFLLPMTLLPAMKAATRLRLPGDISPRLTSTLPKIQDIFSVWDEERFRRVPVSVRTRETGEDYGASGVGCFFSGGVDSFYTALKHQEQISHLIFMELPFASRAVREQASRAARAAARDLGKSLIEIETNLFPFSKDMKIPWSYYHGMRMASVGLLFQSLFRRVLFPASSTYDHLKPRGSHPLLDPLWSTEHTEFEHDGCETRRYKKVNYISKYKVAMEHLRVCYADPNSYNCGRCEKCLRTMLNLKAAGALDRCKTFPGDLDPRALVNLDLSDYTAYHLARQNLKALENLGTEPELTRALAEALEKGTEASKAGTEHLERKRLQEQLSRSHERLKRTQERLESTQRSVHKLKARNKRLVLRNSQLTARYSHQRYTLTETLTRTFLRIPGIGKLRRWRRSTTAD